MNKDNGTHIPNDPQEPAGPDATPGQASRLRRLSRWLGPRYVAAFALVVVVALGATGTFGRRVFGVRAALTASSLPSGFQSASGATYQITPTATTCQQFSSGTASTLSGITYGVKGTKISQTAPGVFFYWAMVTISGTHTVLQSTSPSYPFFFQVAAGSAVYDASCNKVATITQTGVNSPTVTYSTGSGTFFVGIKYTSSSIVGSPSPQSRTGSSTITYSFTTDGGLPSSIQLAHR